LKLKQIRKNRGVSIAKLSIMSSVPIRTIENIERNGNCKVNTAIKLAKALNVTLDELCISESQD